MRIALDQIQKNNDSYVAYVKLLNDSGETIATASVKYQKDPKDLKEAITAKFAAKINEQIKAEAEKAAVKNEVLAVIESIDINEVTK